VNVRDRNNVVLKGQEAGRPLLFAHGFGCDQNMWRFVWPSFAEHHRIVLFDHVGAGRSDTSAFDPQRYSSLQGYAEDVLEICADLELADAVFVGHSVSASIGVVAAVTDPSRFGALVLLGPSPRYVDDEADGYVGGFSREEIDELLTSLESNYLGWSSAMAPAIMGTPERPELGEELTNSFCRTDPELAAHFARTTFLADNRADLLRVQTPTLVLQCSDDVIAPTGVGEYVHDKIAGSAFVKMRARGHCPNLSAPEETVLAIKQFLRA
jgi:sigma-B regulation protein RsbQ